MNDTKNNKYFLYASRKLVNDIQKLYNIITNNGFLTISGRKITKVEDLLTFLLETGIQYTVSKKRTPEEIDTFFQNVASFIGIIRHKTDSFDVPIQVDKHAYSFIQILVSKNNSVSIVEKDIKTNKKITWTPDRDTLLRAFTTSFLWTGVDQFIHHVTSSKPKQEDSNELLR
jgi:hypothetical protein